MPRLCELYPGICLTTEEEAWKTPSQGSKNLNLSTAEESGYELEGILFILLLNEVKSGKEFEKL